jgi:hypothetical protein
MEEAPKLALAGPLAQRFSRRTAMTALGAGAIAAGVAPHGVAAADPDPNASPGGGPLVGPSDVSAPWMLTPGFSYAGLNYSGLVPYAATTTKVVSPGAGAYGTGGSLVGSVDFPNGAVLKELTVWGGAGGQCSLRRATFGVYSWDTVGNVVLPAGSGIVTATAPIADLVVDDSLAAYHVQVFSASAATAILDMRIGYLFDPGATHVHDDRYYTKAQADAALATKANTPVYVPIQPVRVLDSRKPGDPAGGLLTPNSKKLVSVKDGRDVFGAVSVPEAVPAGATAIACNLTATGTTGSNYVSITPGDAPSGASTSAVNWVGAGVSIANGLTIKIDAERRVAIWGGDQVGSTHVILDVFGYFM